MDPINISSPEFYQRFWEEIWLRVQVGAVGGLLLVVLIVWLLFRVWRELKALRAQLK